MICNCHTVRSPYLLILALINLLVFALLSSCGGGGSTTDQVNTGVFVDNFVQGLDYTSPTQDGVTDELGRFRYKDGEQITFFIGEVILGKTTGQEVITPFDLVPEAQNETHPTVTNILRFLQSLDTDGNLENGIQISETARGEIAKINGGLIDFDVSIEDFSSNYDVGALFITLNALNVFTGDQPRQLRTPEQAQEHFRQVVRNSDLDGDGYTADQGDCNDFNAAVNAEAPEICGDAIDQDCDGSDLACASTTTTTSPTSSTTTTSSTTLPTTTTTVPTTTTTVPTTTTTQPATTTTSTSTSSTTTSTTTSSTTTTTLNDNVFAGMIRVGIRALNTSRP